MKPKDTDIEKEKFLDFRKIGGIIQKNFIVLTRDRVRMMPLLLFPILMIIVFGYISGNIPKHISTAIVAYDNSPISQKIQQEISNNQVFSVRYMVSTEGEGKKLLDSGKISVLIEIPPGLQDNIEKGIQTGITIMVDESDSSIGSTAKQTLNTIINKVAYQISLEKLYFFQNSVGMSSIQLQRYSDSHINQYALISSRTAAALQAISQLKKMNDAQTKAYVISLQPATLLIPESYKDIYNYTDANTNYTFIMNPIGDTAIRAQLSALYGSSALLQSAYNNILNANSIATQSDDMSKSLLEYETYEKNVETPLNSIKVFTNYNTNTLIKPIIYEEKPAYGTGKRAIDFVIASIIALTIFQGAVMGMGRAIAGEKREGSLTRVFLTPTSNATIITGTLSFYILFELLRSSFLILISMLLFNIKIEGSFLLIGFILIIYAAIATSLGLAISSMVKTEQQFMAMAMLITMPTMYLSGALFPLQAMPKFMQTLALFLPVTYAGDALRGVMIKGFSIDMILYPLFMLIVFLILTMSLVFMMFKRDIE
jgi:ABC-2 type transport system permease protein